MATELQSGPSEEAAQLLEEQSEQISEALFGRLCWRILPVLWVAYVLNIVDRANLGYASLQMSADLGLTPRSFGVASGVFFLGYAVMQVPSPRCIATDR